MSFIIKEKSYSTSIHQIKPELQKKNMNQTINKVLQ